MASTAAAPAWAALASAEARLIVRNKAVLLTALALPLVFGLAVMNYDLPAGGTGSIVGLQVIGTLLFTVYLGFTMTLVSRRQQLLLKRMLFAPVSHATLIGGLLAPMAVVAFVQTALLAGLAGAATGTAPQRVDLLIAAVLVGTAMSAALGFATASFTKTAESAQYTTIPGFIVIAAGTLAVLSKTPGEVVPWVLAVPGAAVVELARLGWNGGGDTAYVLTACGLVIVGAAVPAAVAAKVFHWNPKR
ncbi:hypothetical protein [Salininema proteolyticum]|uniref:ABC-2 type transport system permease protein n=1 Tax=Salininema proteolyticum TaxID=1607685 RepID=A0ABV8TZR5_9ACTN